MKIFEEFLNKIENETHKRRLEEVVEWIFKTYPTLTPRVAWNQPMFTDHGTFIIGFSVAKAHLAIAPEHAAIVRFSDDITATGYDFSQQIIRIKWNQSFDYQLLKQIIDYNIEDKKDFTGFWRQA